MSTIKAEWTNADALDLQPTCNQLVTDCISRQAAIDALAKNMPSLTTPDGCGEFDHDIQVTDEAYVDCMQIIHELPSAQPEIIRCKECKHWLDIDDGRQKHRMCADVYGDWFCADAERRTNGSDRQTGGD